MLHRACGACPSAEHPTRRIKRLPDGEANQLCRRRALSDDESARFLAAAEPEHRENERRSRAVRNRAPVVETPEAELQPLSTNNTLREIDRLLEAAGIAREDLHGRNFGAHELRRTATTCFARQGASRSAMQRILGRSGGKLTARA
jgi:integrase